MFVVDEDSKAITLHRGDTGELTVTLSGYDFSNVVARALFSLKRAGVVVKEQVYEIDENNQFVVEFANEDTDYVSPGAYEYDVRVVIDPEFDDDGNIVTGTVVRTPDDPLPVTIKRTVGLI